MALQQIETRLRPKSFSRNWCAVAIRFFLWVGIYNETMWILCVHDGNLVVEVHSS